MGGRTWACTEIARPKSGNRLAALRALGGPCSVRIAHNELHTAADCKGIELRKVDGICAVKGIVSRRPSVDGDG